jgi:FtsP/CotA-like multicopper oxidase with cupredoxin domain
MAERNPGLDRRGVLTGLGAAAIWRRALAAAPSADPSRMTLTARPDANGPGKPDGLLWGASSGAAGRASRSSGRIELTFANELPVPALLNWRGLDGIQAIEPFIALTPLAAGSRQDLRMPLRQAGTFLCDLRLLGDDQGRPAKATALIVGESDTVPVDRDEIVLIEDWRVKPDGAALAPGHDAGDSRRLLTINGETSQDFTVRSNERIRLRFVNGCQRAILAVKVERLDVRVMAIDSQPAEPFLARNGALLLAPGARIDAFVDATAPPGSRLGILLHDGQQAQPIGQLVVSDEPALRAAPSSPAPPLPANGLSGRLELRNALRFDLSLGGPSAGWVGVPEVAASPPAFRAKAGRTVVLALTNGAAAAFVFHLHGHHFRLLDRLDDGWKPFWLDTLAIEPGRTERIAFAADYAGRWLLEATAADWAAPRRVRWYNVE